MYDYLHKNRFFSAFIFRTTILFRLSFSVIQNKILHYIFVVKMKTGVKGGYVMLAFEEFGKIVSKIAGKNWRTERIPDSLKSVFPLQVRKIQNAMWKAEVSKSFDSSELARNEINKLYDLAVNCELVVPGKKYLYDKLLCIAEI